MYTLLHLLNNRVPKIIPGSLLDLWVGEDEDLRSSAFYTKERETFSFYVICSLALENYYSFFFASNKSKRHALS
jgi:hypothetical protein